MLNGWRLNKDFVILMKLERQKSEMRYLEADRTCEANTVGKKKHREKILTFSVSFPLEISDYL